MNPQKLLALVLTCAIFITAFAGCAASNQGAVPAAQHGNTGEKINLLWFHHTVELTDWIDNYCKEFSARHPEINLEQELQQSTSTLQVRYAAGDEPEIIMGPQSQQYFDQGRYIDLSVYSNIVDRIDPDIIPRITDQKTGNIYMLPMTRNCFGVFYNKKMFEELGLKEHTNWDDFINNARAIRDNKPDVIPVYFNRNNYGDQTIYLGLGLRILDIGLADLLKAAANNDTATLAFLEAGYIKLYAERVLEMKAEKLFDAEIAITGDVTTATEAFATGKTAMLFDGTWWYGDIRKQFPEVDEFIAFAPVPCLDNRGVYGAKGHGDYISLSANSPYQDELKMVLEELFQDDNLRAYSSIRGAAPSFPDLEASTQWAHPSIMEKVYESYHQPMVSGQTPRPAGFGLDSIDRIGEELILGTLTPDQYAQKVRELWDSCFK